MLDVDNSGTIDLKELSYHLSQLNDGNDDYSSPEDIMKLFQKLDIDENGEISRQEFRTTILQNDATSVTNSLTQQVSADMIFRLLDKDKNGTIDLEELMLHLSQSGYTKNQIRTLFDKMDIDQNGYISKDEFRYAMSVNDDDCPRGYFLNSVQQTCDPLGPIGRISQKLETLKPFRNVYRKISNVFGIFANDDGSKSKIQKLGVSFVLSYSIISNINGAMSFTVAWYISCKRVSY